MVRPGQIYKVAANVLKARHPIIVRASIQRNGVELSTDSQLTKENIPETLIMRVSYVIFCVDFEQFTWIILFTLYLKDIKTGLKNRLILSLQIYYLFKLIYSNIMSLFACKCKRKFCNYFTNLKILSKHNFSECTGYILLWHEKNLQLTLIFFSTSPHCLYKNYYVGNSALILILYNAEVLIFTK